MRNYPQPTMPRSTQHLEEQFHQRRAELAAEWLAPDLAPPPARPVATIEQLQRVQRFVRSHSPGEDAWIDEEHHVVRWSLWSRMPDGEWVTEPCAAATMTEAREELGY